jgi:hypothetical protein
MKQLNVSIGRLAYFFTCLKLNRAESEFNHMKATDLQYIMTFKKAFLLINCNPVSKTIMTCMVIFFTEPQKPNNNNNMKGV